MSKPFDSRVGAYALITRDEHVLLTHWNPRHPGFDGAWTLPGGGMEPGEQPEQTMIREVFEETGFHVESDGLVGVHSYWMTPEQRLDGQPRGNHACRVLYTAHVTGGELAVEQNGSSDDAAWFPIARIDSLKRLDLVDQGLRLSGLTSAVADPDTPPEDIPEQDVATEPGRDR
ncbi:MULTISPECIES: NUDIX hydrolase [Kocuria]|uniref:NUDIX hydrolase n=1 Tax=Kocuria TaxID=57493 RepID=UPI0007EB28E1|nr:MULTISPECIES: NUDIX hydrolase [Kocuria]MBN6812193.1 NUDIX hydrolase [Kocuria indica]MBN6843929.1 NUDIX hydrolase [Kocuria indica]MCT2020580.1 NUDIX hydrolase [Kocuria marina]OBA44836.1 DNA mismatch repair protein MutT [Kocuria sp. ICS0012]